MREAELAVGGDEQVLVWWCDIDGGGLDPGAVGGLLDAEEGVAAEDLCHQAAMPRVEMLHNDHGHRELPGSAPSTSLRAARPPADAASATIPNAGPAA